MITDVEITFIGLATSRTNPGMNEICIKRAVQQAQGQRHRKLKWFRNRAIGFRTYLADGVASYRAGVFHASAIA